MTEARKLGIDAPIRASGNLANTPGCTLVGPSGVVKLQHGVIIAKRHIHIDPENAAKLNLKNNQIVKVSVPSSSRSLIFDEVRVCIDEEFLPAMHIDTDEANAAGIALGTYGEILL